MTKDNLIIILILIIIVTAGICTKKYLDNTTYELTSELEKLKSDIIATDENNGNRDKIKEKMQTIDEEWNKKSEIWSILVLHSELDLIETSLTKMKSELENGSLYISIEALDNSIFLINHIKDKEKFCIKNIL